MNIAHFTPSPPLHQINTSTPLYVHLRFFSSLHSTTKCALAYSLALAFRRRQAPRGASFAALCQPVSFRVCAYGTLRLSLFSSVFVYIFTCKSGRHPRRPLERQVRVRCARVLCIKRQAPNCARARTLNLNLSRRARFRLRASFSNDRNAAHSSALELYAPAGSELR